MKLSRIGIDLAKTLDFPQPGGHLRAIIGPPPEENIALILPQLQ